MSEAIEWIKSDDVFTALSIIDPTCAHPRDKVRWKLSTAEYHCRECWTLFPYKQVQEIVNSVINNTAEEQA